MASVEITVSPDDVRDALDGKASETYAFEIRQAEAIVNDELAPVADADDTDRLGLVGALIAAAYARDDGDGGISSATEMSGSVSFDNDNAITMWERAVQMDPTGRLTPLGGFVPSAKATGRPI